MPDNRNPGWKAAGPKADSKGPRYGWKATAGEAAPGRGPRRLKQGMFVLGGLGCVALIIVLFKLLQSPPHSGLALVGTDPAADFDRLDAPLDAYGWQGGKQLAAWASTSREQEQSRWGKLTPAVVENDVLPLSADAFPEWIDRLASEKSDPLVVYFGMHGGGDVNGPFLWAAGGSRLDVKTVINAFAGNKFARRRVVLLFDPARLDPNPVLGQLFNDFARGLQKLESDIQNAQSQLVVICGSSPGERAWDSEEWRTTAFGHAIAEGLGGAAAASGQTSISAWQLFEYVKRRTVDWTGANRPTAQTPFLLPSADSGGRDRASGITVAVKMSESPPADAAAAPGADFKVPDSLLARWRECDRLARAMPSPAAYTPRLWRRYRELLLRYEYLIRANQANAAGKLALELQEDERQLDEARTLRRLALSRTNALPMPVAIGGDDVATWTATQEAKFRDLWAARTNEADRTTLLTAIRTAGWGSTLDAYLLDRAANPSRPAEELTSALSLLAAAAAADPGTPRPAEVHFALMLNRFDWGQEKPPVDVLRLAIATRMLAERAALAAPAATGEPAFPYSERIWPAIKASVEAADALRRPGEDLLFSSQQYWNDAKAKLSAAKAKYDEALTTRRQLQAAYATRDQVFADLPFLTRWQSAESLDSSKLRDLVELWNNGHTLDRMLTAARFDDTLPSLALKVQSSFQALRQQFDRDCQAGRELSVLQRNWRQLEELLAVPMIAPNLRRELVELSRSMSQRWSAEQSQPKDNSTVQAEDAAKIQAERCGRLAVAALFDSGEKESAQLRALVVDLPAKDWESAALRAGSQLAAGWAALLGKATDSDRAETASRSAVAFATAPPPEPATTNRLRRWQSLLGELARRTALDHWYSESGEPFFRVTARRFLDDAAALGEKPLANLDEITKLIDAPSLKLDGPSAINWTSELARQVHVSVKAPPALPKGGFISLWPELGAGPLKLKPEEEPRQPAEPAAAERLLHLTIAPSAANADVPLTLHGYFRGQQLASKTLVRIDRMPSAIYQRPAPPNEAGFAVRADGDLRLGAIAIVLDLSGSMQDRPEGKPDWRDKNSKFSQALRVLRKALASIPKGTPLSIRIFGHRPPPQAAPANFDQGQKEAFETSRTPSEQIFKEFVSWSPENPEPLQNLMERIASKEPLYGTPLVRTMREAKEFDFPIQFNGPKNLLVLTDGADTSYLPADRIEKVRQEFADAFENAGIGVQVILFRVSPNEEATAQAQFAGIEKLKPPGRLWTAKDESRLTESIERAMRPRVRLLADGEPAKGVPPAGLPANLANDRLDQLRPSGPIAPRLYDAMVFTHRQQVWFDRGDRLLIRLLRDADGVQFRRDLFADSLATDRKAIAGDWVLGVPQVRDDPTPQMGRLRLMATLETTRGQLPGRSGILKQTAPSYVIWDVAPTSAAPPNTSQLRVTSLPGYPAPAWDIVMNDWPAEPRPVTLTAWVGSDPPTGRRIPIDVNKVLAGGFEQTITMDGQPVLISVAHEVQPLRTGEDQPSDPPAVPCIVVRIGYPQDRPMIVRLDGLKAIGQEDRFYTAANAYTGLFGPVTRDELAGLKLELDLITLAQLKDGGTKIKIDLPPPRLGEPRPQPMKLATEGAGQ